MTSLQEALVESADYFASQTLGGDAKRARSTRRKRAWAASVDATNDEKRRVCVYISRPSLAKMAKLFLNEETPNDEILRDLIGEIANSIVGKAKALASDRGLKFDISAPRFEGKAKAIGKGATFILHYAFAGDCFSVCVVGAEL
ncbi:MAG: chemotaxis protein CheX [Helicobacteraceae bacterium]|jgi:chemotaxis protein CheY-P-specific phosphatase CheC|nr:chemotaxis protein CheX [Helicobacteraceae bacterium]